ncbi:MAG: bifunctional diaminohydroxyphosphoribosylaminopyrimidine deaminase/5-amino-6-(5-phosphoribosylamino)uracil reductase RibD [Phycisphaerae bacterium]|nr:bifunctional diaminohydroxyphosphoribosylaminopyrimidine deaminase/5-amino-6-(5-phosphoribosylamino)uracil reductase RibD [Phycisphaerae bacterium]
MESQDSQYMKIALGLARRGIGSVEPNPAVGCVIVKSDQIIGRGWHKQYGGPHAEIHAIQDCQTIGAHPGGATLYVTLEPCCHHGNTGPCTDALIEAKLRRVVVAARDPSAHASGAGLRQLERAGIEVATGVCEDDARILNAPFFKFVETGKSWVVLKWAQSLDGKLAYADPAEGRWLSGEDGRRDAHALRRRTQAILVGVNTVIADNPLLTPRPSRGRNPVRIVLDRNLRIPRTSRLLSTARNHPLLICTTARAAEANPKVVAAIQKKGAEILAGPASEDHLRFVLEQVAARGIQQLLVEGGASVLASFLRGALADEVCVYVAPLVLGAQGRVELGSCAEGMAPPTRLGRPDIKRLGDDVRIRGFLGPWGQAPTG